MGKHSEVIPCNLPASVRWALCDETFRHSQHEVIYRDEKELIGKHETNREKVHATIVTAGVEVTSEGMFPGPRRERVEEFVRLFQVKAQKLTPEQQEKMMRQAAEHVLTEEYVPPAKLPPPQQEEFGTPLYSVAAGLLITAIAGYLFVVVDRTGDFNWPMVTLFSYSFALGYCIRWTAQLGKFYNLQMLGALVIVCSLALGTWSMYYDYSRDYLDTENKGRLFFTIVLRFVIPFLFGYGLVRETVRKARKSAVPEEVLRFALYTHNANSDETALRMALAKKGWHADSDQDKVIQALRAHLQLKEHDKHLALKK